MNCFLGALPLHLVRLVTPGFSSRPLFPHRNRRRIGLVRAFGASCTSAPLSSSHLVDATAAPEGYDDSAVVYEDVVSEEESQAIVSDLSTRLKRYGAS
jgi:hypothetical protein